MFKFKKKPSLQENGPAKQGLWQKCHKCDTIIYNKEWEESFRVCSNCNYHYPLSSHERIQLLTDPDSFEERYKDILPTDFLNFEWLGTSYSDKLKEVQNKTGLDDAMIAGRAQLFGIPISLAVMDFKFMGGSMGSVVGERFAQAALDAIKQKTSFIVVTTSGGARMQEGLTSLMQMAKTAAVVVKLNESNTPYIVVITDPTYGGVTASFAMLGDIIISEPQARSGFAGARVIEQTLKQKLPDGFQSAEFLLEHGFIDMIVDRKNLKNHIAQILRYVGA